MATSPASSLPPVRPREIVAWAMFDFANSSYTTVIVTVAFSVYFTRLVAAGSRADFLWGLALAIAKLLVVLLAPGVGAAADAGGRKKTFLFATYLLCVLATISLYWVEPGMVVLGLVLFVLSDVGFSLGGGLASAFLPEISTPENIGRVSGFAWGFGYFGGLAALFLVRPLLAGGFTTENVPGLRLAWVVTGLFFLVAAIPTFVWLRERAPRRSLGGMRGAAVNAYGRLRTTFRSVRHFAQLGRFLVVYLLATAGLAAVIAFSAVYAERTIGFGPDELIVLFLSLQLTAAAGAFLFGVVLDRIGARRTILLALVLWLAVCLGAAASTTKQSYWAVALVAGFGIGSLQSSARALLGLLAPVGKSGEFFGFGSLAGQVAGAAGPLAFGLASSLAGSQRVAVVLIALFFLAALLAMLRVDEEAGRRAAREWEERLEA